VKVRDDGRPPPNENAPHEQPLGEASEVTPASEMMAAQRAAVNAAALDYVRNGWVLVPIDAGTKGPTTPGWNKRTRCVDSAEAAERITGNVGLAHAYSRTAALDVDNLAGAQEWLQTRQIDLQGLLQAEDAVRISSGRPGRGKLLFRLPAGLAPLPTKKIAEGKTTLLEFRCASASGATVQDVLPPSLHPVTGRPYVWEYGGLLGHWTQLPVLPQSLLALWQELIGKTRDEPAEVKEPLGLGRRELRIMLSRLEPDTDYDEWLHVGMALHHETRGGEVGLELWDTWSSKGTKYQGHEDLAKRWENFKAEGAGLLTARWLMGLADIADVDEFDDLTEPSPDAPKGTAALLRLLEHRPLTEIVKPEPPRFLVEGLLQQGQAGLWVSAGGSGKTTFTMLLACCVATGRDFLGVPVSRTGRSVILSRDDSQDDLHAVLQDVVIANGFNDAERVLILDRVSVISLRTESDAGIVEETKGGRSYRRSRFARELVEHLATLDDLALVALDTIRVFSGTDSSDEQAQTIVMQLLHQMAGLPQRPVAIGLHHTGKGNARAKVEDQYAAMGSSALADHARFVFVMRLLDADDLRSLKLADGEVLRMDADVLQLVSARGSIRVRKPAPIHALRDGYELAPLGLRRPTKREAANDALLRVARHLHDKGPAPREELARVVGGAMALAREHVDKGVSDGLLYVSQEGKRRPHRLTDAGRELAQQHGVIPAGDQSQGIDHA
jgi:hypothetical protein